MQTQSNQMWAENNRSLWLLIVVTTALLLWFFFDGIVYWTCLLLHTLWLLLYSLSPEEFSNAAWRINLLARTGNQARMVTFDEWLGVMNATAGIILIMLLPAVLLACILAIRHPAASYRSKRVIDINNLAWIMVKHSPSIAPVLCYGHPREMLLNDTSPEQAVSLSPEGFTQHHSLIWHEILDRERATAVFRTQLGRPLKSLDDLNGYERALFAVFGLQVFCNDRKAATQLLDDLNLSCLIRSRRDGKKYGYPLLSLARRPFERARKAMGVKEWLQTHAWIRTGLVGLYSRDLRLPPSRFHWLKGLDRTLWYALHTADTTAVFIEGAGVVTQARAETAAKNHGYPCPGIDFNDTLDALQTDLENIGELPSSAPVPDKPLTDNDNL